MEESKSIFMEEIFNQAEGVYIEQKNLIHLMVYIGTPIIGIAMLFVSFYLGKTFNNKNAKLSKLILDKQKELATVKNRQTKYSRLVKISERTIKLLKYITLAYFAFTLFNSYFTVFNNRILLTQETAYFLAIEAIIYVLCRLIVTISLKRLAYHENMLNIEEETQRNMVKHFIDNMGFEVKKVLKNSLQRFMLD